MKTNKLRYNLNRMNVLFSLIAVLIFPFIGSAQLNVTNANKVGIGTSTPSEYLDVVGNVNVGTSNAFQIGTNKMLWNNGTTSDIMVGYEAGNSSMTGHSNTFVGYNSGHGNTTGAGISAFGYNALTAQTTGSATSAFGYSALSAATTGSYNNAFGYQALSMLTTASYNNAFGYQALTAHTSGSGTNAFGYKSMATNTTGNDNDAFGYQALYSNTTGGGNVAFGFAALYANATSYYSCAFGYEALYNNTGTENIGVGHFALSTNTSGTYNIAVGGSAGISNSTGSYNTCIGGQALYSNSASNNTATGYRALSTATSGSNNSAFGYQAGNTITTGSGNTFIGYNADVAPACSTFTNMTAIGYSTQASVVATGNYVALGNTSVGSIQGQVGFTTYSDSRIKNSVQKNVPGLAFINLLQPVTYHYDIHKENSILGYPVKILKDSSGNILSTEIDTVMWNGKYEIENKLFSGFIAQQVDSIAQKIGYDFSGVDKKGALMGLRYSEFVVPLVQAVQELSKAQDSLTTLSHKQDSINNVLQQQLTDLANRINTCCPSVRSKTTNNNQINFDQQDIELSDKNVIVLNQNVPNPFAEQTTISYTIPENTGFAQIIFYNNLGQMIKAVDIKTKGRGKLNVFANDLTNGIYSYTLIVDGKIIDTKKMVKAE